MDVIDISEWARMLFEQHGPRAMAVAAQRAKAAEADNDKELARTWRQVEAALAEMRGPPAS